MIRAMASRLVGVSIGVLLLSGCVMAEKYEAEKSRALNFQRLLAQEEKRTAELDAELKRAKRESSEMDARNREMTAQLQAVREQMARIQDETAVLREEAAALRERALEQRSQVQPSKGKPKRAPKAASPKMAEPSPEPSMAPEESAKAAGGAPVYHTVKRGETLYRISKQYGTDVKTLQELNNLPDNNIEVGQRLIVGHE
jgi:LysM repeat protein